MQHRTGTITRNWALALQEMRAMDGSLVASVRYAGTDCG
jgi:hypothetical protein